VTALGTVSVHHVGPRFFFGYEETGRRSGRLATPEKALVDFLYLGPARSRLFRALPELNWPRTFNTRLARSIVGRIAPAQRRTFETTERTDEPTWSVSLQPATSLRVRASGLHNLHRTRGSSPTLLPDGSSNSNPAYDYGGYGLDYWENTYSATVDYTPGRQWMINMTAGSTMYNSRTPRLPDEPSWSFVGSNVQFDDIPAASRFPAGHCNCEQNSWAVRKDLTERRVLNVSVARDLTLAGRHQVKGGMQLERITNDVDNGYLYPMVGLYWDASYWASDGSVTRGKYGYYSVYQYLEIGKVQSNNMAFFLQDDWAVTNRLTVNLGVRADREHIPSYRPENASIHFGFGDKIAPRVGFALDVRGDARWRLYGSAGRFQDVTKLSLPRYEFGASRDFEAIYTLDDWDWTAIQCMPWAGGCAGRLIETSDWAIPWNQAEAQLEALGYNSQLEPNWANCPRAIRTSSRFRERTKHGGARAWG
jgi:outer membrane receptor protein involved in Fe transport